MTAIEIYVKVEAVVLLPTHHSEGLISVKRRVVVVPVELTDLDDIRHGQAGRLLAILVGRLRLCLHTRWIFSDQLGLDPEFESGSKPLPSLCLPIWIGDSHRYEVGVAWFCGCGRAETSRIDTVPQPAMLEDAWRLDGHLARRLRPAEVVVDCICHKLDPTRPVHRAWLN